METEIYILYVVRIQNYFEMLNYESSHVWCVGLPSQFKVKLSEQGWEDFGLFSTNHWIDNLSSFVAKF